MSESHNAAPRALRKHWTRPAHFKAWAAFVVGFPILISSVQTGPKTAVQVYDNDNYMDPVAAFKPGQSVPDVSKRTGVFRRVFVAENHVHLTRQL